MDSFAHEGPKDPVIQGIDGGLEGHAEDYEAEVSHPQVENEEIGGIVHLLVPQQHCQHQRVAHGANQENQRVYKWNDDRHQLPTVALNAAREVELGQRSVHLGSQMRALRREGMVEEESFTGLGLPGMPQCLTSSGPFEAEFQSFSE